MVLEAKAKLSRSRNSATIYIAIPADLAKDNQFPFRIDDELCSGGYGNNGKYFRNLSFSGLVLKVMHL
jgi:hypothetical protein